MHQSAAFRKLYLMVPEAARADKVAKPRFREVSTQLTEAVMGLEGHKALLSAGVPGSINALVDLAQPWHASHEPCLTMLRQHARMCGMPLRASARRPAVHDGGRERVLSTARWA